MDYGDEPGDFCRDCEGWQKENKVLDKQMTALEEENAALKARVAGTLAELGYSQWALTEANAEARALRQQLDQARNYLQRIADNGSPCDKGYKSDWFPHEIARSGLAAISEPTTEPFRDPIAEALHNHGMGQRDGVETMRRALCDCREGDAPCRACQEASKLLGEPTAWPAPDYDCTCTEIHVTKCPCVECRAQTGGLGGTTESGGEGESDG